jgi:hypothetical protein
MEIFSRGKVLNFQIDSPADGTVAASSRLGFRHIPPQLALKY